MAICQKCKDAKSPLPEDMKYHWKCRPTKPEEEPAGELSGGGEACVNCSKKKEKVLEHPHLKLTYYSGRIERVAGLVCEGCLSTVKAAKLVINKSEVGYDLEGFQPNRPLTTKALDGDDAP